MKETERLNILKQIEEEKEKMLLLKEQFNKFKTLEENPIVKEYLSLKEELEDVKILDDEKVVQKVFDKQYHNTKCEHDIYFYIGGYIIEYDLGPESRDRYYRVFDKDKIQYYSYYCLDCFEEVMVPKKEHEKFIKENQIIKIKKRYITSEDFKMVQKIYFDLLLNNSSEEAHKILMKKYFS